jgi:serine/threonine-protein phosphatase PPG1
MTSGNTPQASSGLNLDKCIEQLMRNEVLSETTVRELCEKLKEQLIDESNVVILKTPLTVVGDIQG